MPWSSPELPSSDDLKSAAESSPSSDLCRKLVLDVLTYGSEAHESRDSRTVESSKVLAEAWTNCPNLEDTLVDGLWLISSTLPASDDDEKSSIKSLAEILKSLLDVPGRNEFWVKLQGNLPSSLLEAVGLIASEQELLKKLKMHNTQVHYKQQRYNLLQEESEGYSKVLHLLISGAEVDPTQRRKRLSQLIGIFELDPNRVLDLMVDILEAKLFPSSSVDKTSTADTRKYDRGVPLTTKPCLTTHISWLLDLMKEFSLDKLPPLIGFKLEGDGDNEALLRLIAFLATEGLLDLKSMVEDYFPSIEDNLKEAHKVHWMKEKRRVQALGRITLSGVQKEDPKQAEYAQRLQKSLDPVKNSQFVKILLILLEWHEWELVKPLLSLERWSHLCSVLPTKFGFVLCDIAQERIRPWYTSRIRTPSLMSKASGQQQQLPSSTSASDGLNVDQLVKVVSEPLLCTVQSSCIAYRPILYCQLCRILKSILRDDKEDEHILSDDAYMFFKKFLVPSLSLFPASPAISTELWSVLKRLPYSTRYRLYGDWRGTGLEKSGIGSSPTGKPLACVEREMVAGKQARYALKRLSKDNIRDMSRHLAKVAHSNPLVLFSTILNQIESYDNMIELMVEAQRFVGPLGLDVLGYCILSRLSGMAGGVNRSRLKEDGVNVSQWLQSMEAFSGAFYKRCPYVEFRGMLCYLMRRLRDGNVMELGILRTLLKKPGGYSFSDYSPAESLSITQMEGRAGSITLKRETISFGIVEEVNLRASERIRGVLQTDGFGVSMLILIAQVRSRIVFESSKMPLKLVGNLYDSCQVVRSILLEFLTEAANDETFKSAIMRYAETLPTLKDLITRYGFNVSTAWSLCRPLVRAATSSTSNFTGKDSRFLKRFELTEDTRKSYQSLLGDETWSSISPTLFETFYANSLCDIFCPQKVYNTEINRLGKEIERIQHRHRTDASSSLHIGAGPPKNDGGELDRLKTVKSVLCDDLSKQSKHVKSVHAIMQTTKTKFFPSDKVSREAMTDFLTHCIFPRSTTSPDDAVYCARFVLLLHKLDTPGFSTMHYFDQLISAVAGALFGVTEGEAAHLAILLWETWKVVNKWRYDEKTFDAEVARKPGSFMLASSLTADDCSGDDSDKSVSISYKDFGNLYNKWHSALGSVLISCLKSSEYMHTRACLIILTRLVEVFPTRPKLGNKLLKVLEPLQADNSSLQDIRASANAYGTMLLKARDEGKWVEEDAAVAKARLEKERAAAELRKKKIAESFQEMQRDNQKINEELSQGMRGRRMLPRGELSDSRGMSTEASRLKVSSSVKATENGGRTGTDEHSRQANVRVESGEVSNGHDRMRDRHDSRSFSRPSPPGRDGDRRDRDRGSSDDRGRSRTESGHPASSSGRSGSDRAHISDSRSRRDGTSGAGGGGGSGGASSSGGPGGGDSHRGLRSRWTPSETAPRDAMGRSNKRSRPSSPETTNDSGGRDSRGVKRQRMASSSGGGNNDYEPSSRETRGSSPPPRRGRGSSPSRSTPPPSNSTRAPQRGARNRRR